MALSAEELIAKKELIEAEIRAQHDFLEKVSRLGKRPCLNLVEPVAPRMRVRVFAPPKHSSKTGWV